MRKLLAAYKMNNYEAGALAVCAVLIFFQYLPLFNPSFPIEQEAAVFLHAVASVGWWDALGTSNYLPIYPILNFLLKMGAIIIAHAGKPVYFSLILAIHLGNTAMLMMITRKAIDFGGSGQSRESGGPIPVGSLGGIAAALLFAVFNAYYLVISSPLTASIFVAVLFFILNFLLIGLESATNSLEWDSRFFTMAGIALLLPFLWPFLLIFLAAILMLSLFLKSRLQRRQLLLLAAIHLFAVLIQVRFLDVRFGNGEKATLVPFMLANPALYGFAVLQNVWSGFAFGLVYQNFLLFSAPYSFPYLAGFLALFFWVVVVLLPKVRPNLSLGFFTALALMLASILNICLLRNSLSRDEGRLFDGLFIASQPRYFYLPTAFMAMALGFALVSFWIRIRAWVRVSWAVLAFLAVFSFAAVMGTRSKVDFAAEHMTIEIWKYVPYRLLRPPEANPEAPSFLKGYSGLIH